jgi:hypothetical protein
MFLMISLAVFVASVIAVILYYCEAIAELNRILSQNTDTQFRFGLEMSLFLSMFFTIAVLGSELSFVRSVYKMLKHKPRRWIGICYLVSAVLAVLSVAFYCLIVLKVFNFASASGRDYAGDVYLLTFWPSFLVSFALGSVPVKQND